MTPSLTVETIFFGINAALHMGNTFQRAYANSLKSRELVLPLPDFNKDIKETTIENFFNKNGKRGGKQFLDKLPRLKHLHENAEFTKLSDEDYEEYLDFYKTFFHIARGTSGELNETTAIYLLRVRQWVNGKTPHPSPLQLVSASLIELGIDYFNQVPGAFNYDSIHGKFIRSFLLALDEVKFEAGGSFKTKIIQEVLPQLFIAAAETTGSIAPEFIKDEKIQRFVEATTQGLSHDLYNRINQLPTAESEKWPGIIQWGQVVFSSLVKHSGQYVFSSDNQFIQTNAGKSKLIESTGLLFLDLLLNENGQLVNFKNVLNVEALDRMVKSALSVVAEYPELVAGNRDGVREIVEGVSSALLQSDINRPDLFPDLVQLILHHTSSNLELLWDIQTTDSKHLLITGLKHILDAVASSPNDGKWKPRFSKNQLLLLTQELLEEVVSNPVWVQDKVNESSILSEVLHATFSSLEQIPQEERLSIDTVHALIKTNLRAVAASRALLQKIKFGTDVEKQTVLNGVLNIVFDCVYAGIPFVDKSVIILELADYVLTSILSRYPDNKGLTLAQFILSEQTGVIRDGGFSKSTADNLLKAAMRIMASHPDLLVQNDGLQNILSGVFSAWAQMGSKQPDLLPELIRTLLNYSSENLHALVETPGGSPQSLLVVALKQILSAISEKPAAGKWKPAFSNIQILMLSQNLLDEVVANPSWIKDKVEEASLLSLVLNATFSALETIPAGERLQFDTIHTLLKSNLRAVTSNKNILNTLPIGTTTEKHTVLNMVLDIVFECVYERVHLVDKSLMIMELTDFILHAIITKNPDTNGLQLARFILHEKTGIIQTTGFNQGIANILVDAAFRAMSAHPHLLAENNGLQNILSGTLSAWTNLQVHNNTFLLPELMRIILELSAENMENLFNIQTDGQHLLVAGMQQIIQAITTPPPAGVWKPRFTDNQILEITQFMLGELTMKPQLIKDKSLNTLLSAIFQALETTPGTQRLHYTTLRILIMESVRAASRKKKLLVKLHSTDGSIQTLALTYSLESLFITLYDENNQSEGTWTLTQTAVINAIIEHYLPRIAGLSLTKEEIDASASILKQEVANLNNNLQFNLNDLLNKLSE